MGVLHDKGGQMAKKKKTINEKAKCQLMSLNWCNDKNKMANILKLSEV